MTPASPAQERTRSCNLVSSENFSRESLRKSQEGVNELLVQLDAQSHGTTQRMTCHRQDADLAIRLNATLLPYLISQDFLSFHHLASFIDVALADDAERDIQAIPRVAQFSLPGQGPFETRSDRSRVVVAGDEPVIVA